MVSPAADEPRKRRAVSPEHEARTKRNTAALLAWCERYGKGARTYLMRRTGLTFAAVSRIVNGKAQPSPASAAAFEAATDGQVRAAALLGISDGHAPENSPVNCGDEAPQ